MYSPHSKQVFLIHEELLGLETTLAFAALTSQHHLLGTALPALKMIPSNVCQSLNEDRTPVQALGSFHAWMAFGILVHDLLIQFVQCFDVITRKSDGYKYKVRLTSIDILSHSVTCLGTKPS